MAALARAPAAALALALACNAAGEPAAPALDPAATPSRCAATAVTVLASPRRLRRLGDRELTEVASDIAGAPIAPVDTAELAGDPQVDGWETDARAFVVSGPKLDGYLAVVAKLAPAIARTAACLPFEGARECAGRFARTTATRAFGRPATADEVADLLAVFDTGVTTENAAAGFRLVVQAILLAPSMLYRSEIGIRSVLASRASMPSDALARASTGCRSTTRASSPTPT